MFATDIPGYVQGFRFSDDSEFYDSIETRFRDLAGYDHRGNGLTITVGTPAFVDDASGERGLTLDNTVQGEFLPAIPWNGACVAVMRPNMVTNSKNIYPVIVGQNGTLTNNGAIRLRRANATTYLHSMISGGTMTACSETFTDGGLKVAAFALSQKTRIGYSTADGTTVHTTSALADAGNGNGLAFGSLGNAGVSSAFHPKARFGNLSGTDGDSAVMADTCTMLELHFFKGNPLVDNLAEVKAFMDELKATYGVA